MFGLVAAWTSPPDAENNHPSVATAAQRSAVPSLAVHGDVRLRSSRRKEARSVMAATSFPTKLCRNSSFFFSAKSRRTRLRSRAMCTGT